LEKKGPVILETYIKYKKEILIGEEICIKTSCLEYKGLLGKMAQEMYKENGKMACRAEFSFGLFNLEKRKLLYPEGLWKEIHLKMMNS
jgi:acyl-CoA thioesterase FadM